LLGNIVDKPFWVKQAIFLELRDDIKKMTCVELLEVLDKNDLLQLYVPRLTSLGHKVLQDNDYANSLSLGVDMMTLIKNIDGKKNVIDQCYACSLTLKAFSNIIIDFEERGFVEPIRSSQIINVFKFIADRIDIGTLLLKLNKITADQLSFASYTHQEAQKAFIEEEDTSLEDILIRLNYVSKEQLNSLMLLKQASEIIFEFDNSTSKECCLELESLHESIEIITAEKQLMQEQLDDVKPLLESKDRKIKELEEEIKQYKEELLKYQKNSNSIFSKL
ncbi:MAG: hypothetical protein AB7V50_11200, partial [Vampirovibrionia bacterium]